MGCVIVAWAIETVLAAAIFFAAGAWFGGRRLRIYRTRDPPHTNHVD